MQIAMRQEMGCWYWSTVGGAVEQPAAIGPHQERPSSSPSTCIKPRRRPQQFHFQSVESETDRVSFNAQISTWTSLPRVIASALIHLQIM